MVYLFLFISIAGTTLSQLLMKQGMVIVGQFPKDVTQSIFFFIKSFTSPWVISSLMVAFLACLAWMAAMSKASLSFIYPFISLSFVFVLLFSTILFKEEVSILRWIGVLVICLGVFLVSRS